MSQRTAPRPGPGRRLALVGLLLTLALGLAVTWLLGAGRASQRSASGWAVLAPHSPDSPDSPNLPEATDAPGGTSAGPTPAGAEGLNRRGGQAGSAASAAGVGPRQAEPPAASPALSEAATATATDLPGAAPDEPPGDGASDAKPHRIDLARSARDPQATKRLAAQTAALPPGSIDVVSNDGQGRVQYQDRAGRPGLAELQRARVGEADLGLRFMPGSQVLGDQSQRIQDPTGGLTVMATLSTAAPLARVASHYRDQLTQGTVVQESIPAPGELVLSTLDPRTGVNRVVWLSQQQGGVVQARVAQAAPPAWVDAREAGARRP